MKLIHMLFYWMINRSWKFQGCSLIYTGMVKDVDVPLLSVTLGTTSLTRRISSCFFPIDGLFNDPGPSINKLINIVCYNWVILKPFFFLLFFFIFVSREGITLTHRSAYCFVNIPILIKYVRNSSRKSDSYYIIFDISMWIWILTNLCHLTTPLASKQ